MRGGPMAGMMRGDKPADFSGTMGKLINYMGRYKYLVVVVVIFAIASTAANIFGPKILGNATTTLVNGLVAQIAGTGSIDFGQIGTILLQFWHSILFPLFVDLFRGGSWQELQPIQLIVCAEKSQKKLTNCP